MEKYFDASKRFLRRGPLTAISFHTVGYDLREPGYRGHAFAPTARKISSAPEFISIVCLCNSYFEESLLS